MATRTRESRGGRLVAATLLGLVALAGAGYLVLAWFTSGKVPHGTSVEGIGIGGLSTTAAEQRLRDGLAGRSNRTLVLTWHGDRFQVEPAAAGLAVDVDATVRAAGGSFSLDPSRIWRYFAGGQDVPAEVSVAGSSMGSQLDRIAAAVGRKPVEGTITFDGGTAHEVLSRPGIALDREATRELLVHEFLHGGEHTVPVGPAEPYVSAEAVDKAMRDFARPAMAAPVVLVVGGQAIIATPQQYSPAISMVPHGHELRPVVDGRRLLAAIRPAMTTVGDKPRNARIQLVDGKPTVVPAVVGATFDVEDLAARFPAYVAKPPGQRRMRAKAVVQQPRFTTADARALGVSHVVAQATVGFSDGPGADAAVTTMAQSLSGRLLRPHRILTVSAAADPTSAAASSAQSLVASALYTSAFSTGLEVVERTALQAYHATFPLGVDARVDAAHQLRLRDNTPYGVLLDVRVQAARPGRPGAVTVRLWSSPYWDVSTRTGPRRQVSTAPVRYDDTTGCRPVSGSDGFTVTVTRVLRHGGRTADRSAFTSRYRATAGVACGSSPAVGGSSPPPGPGNGHVSGHGQGHGAGHGPGPG